MEAGSELKSLLCRRLQLIEGKSVSSAPRTVSVPVSAATPSSTSLTAEGEAGRARVRPSNSAGSVGGETRARFRGSRYVGKERVHCCSGLFQNTQEKEVEESRRLELRVASMNLRVDRALGSLAQIRDKCLESTNGHDFGPWREAFVREVDALLGSERGGYRGETNGSRGRDSAPAVSSTGAAAASPEDPRVAELTKECGELRKENEGLKSELEQLRRANEAAGGSSGSGSAPAHKAAEDGPENRLKTLMTTRGVSTAELRNAILSVDALVEEARRELKAAQLRERRAAYEKLHQAMEKEDEDAMEHAIHVAKETEVDIGEIVKAECKLLELRALTPEQKAAKLAVKVERERKKEAFLLVKRDDSTSLQALLENLEVEGIRWQDWRDYAGRSLWRCAQELRAERVQQYLAPLCGQSISACGRRSVWEERRTHSDSFGRQTSVSDRGSPSGPDGSSKVNSPNIAPASAPAEPRESLASALSRLAPLSPEAPPRIPQEIEAATAPKQPQSPSLTAKGGLGIPQIRQSAASTSTPSKAYPLDTPTTPTVNGGTPKTPGSSIYSARLHVHGSDDDPHKELKAKALRAVAQDDEASLGEVLAQLPPDVWSQWENKAGKDLMTLSQERGSTVAYSMLARELGVLKELVRDTFEEREAVWVFEVGEVQPRRATVMEDTPEEADEILVEFWDGDAPATRVERCLVRKMG